MSQLEIVDNRIELTWVPAERLLRQALPCFKSSALAGIRRIVLADRDPRPKKRSGGARARYSPIGRTRSAEILIFFEFFETLPDTLKKSDLYLTFLLLQSLLHELHHHKVRGHRTVRRPKSGQEEDDAARIAQAGASLFVKQLYPPDQQRQEWEEMHLAVALWRRKSSGSDSSHADSEQGV